METVSALLTLCGRNPPVTIDFLSLRPVTLNFNVSFDLCLNTRLSKQPGRRWFQTPSRSLWRHCYGLGWQKHIYCTTWWRHQMETVSTLMAICAGNSPVAGEFPIQRPVTRSFDVFFHLCLNKRLSKQSRGWWFETPSHPLWRRFNEPMICHVQSISGHSIPELRILDLVIYKKTSPALIDTIVCPLFDIMFVQRYWREILLWYMCLKARFCRIVAIEMSILSNILTSLVTP